MRPRPSLALLLLLASASAAAAHPIVPIHVGTSAGHDAGAAVDLRARAATVPTGVALGPGLALDARLAAHLGSGGTSGTAAPGTAPPSPGGRVAGSGDAPGAVDTETAAVAAGGAGIALALAWLALRAKMAHGLLGRGAAVLAAPLFSRIGRSELLENETRERIYGIVRENPGLSMKEIGERAGTGWGTVVYHLERLEAASFLASRHTAGNRCYFAVGHVPPEEREAVGLLQRDTPKRIAELLLHRPGANQTDVCEALGIAASTAHKHLGRLEEANLVTRERAWRSVRYRPTDLLRDQLGVGEPPAAAAGAEAIPA